MNYTLLTIRYIGGLPRAQLRVPTDRGELGTLYKLRDRESSKQFKAGREWIGLPHDNLSIPAVEPCYLVDLTESHFQQHPQGEIILEH